MRKNNFPPLMAALAFLTFVLVEVEPGGANNENLRTGALKNKEVTVLENGT